MLHGKMIVTFHKIILSKCSCCRLILNRARRLRDMIQLMLDYYLLTLSFL